VFQTSASKPTLTDDDFIACLNDSGTHYQIWDATFIHGGVIRTNTVDTNELNADAVTATELNIVGIDGTTGRIVVADATDANAVTAGINTYAATLIQAGKILISGDTNLDDWSHGTDATKIDGGNIYTNSVTATQIAAGAITTTEIAADTIVAGNIAAGAVATSEIAADAVTAAELNIVGIDGTTGRIVVADATDANAVTTGINTYAATLIQPGKILISGATNLDDWSHGSDATKIDGGDIYTNSITATQIAAATITTTEIAADTIVAGNIAAGAVTTSELAADAVTAPELNVIGIDGATGRIVVADATDANAVTGGINAYASTLISAGKVLISGATNLDDWSHASDATLIDGGDIYTNTITATQIAGDTITADQIAANAVTASELNVVGIDGTTGRIVVADATDANAVTAGINTHAVTLIDPGKILISGDTNLDDWSHGSDATKIDGGNIYTNSITATQIAANTVTADEIAANAVTASELDVVGIDGATGRIVVSDATDANAVTNGINTYAVTLIQPGKILISGATNLDDWSHGSDATKIDGGDIYTNSVTAAQIAADTITAAQMAANSITATELNVVGIDGTTGRIVVADATDANTVTAGINSYASTLIQSGKVLISGGVNLDDWSHGSDATMIDGGDIYAHSVIASKLTILAHLLTGGTWTDDSPAGGYVAWSGFSVEYNGTTYAITNDNTANKYIWWDLDNPTVFQASAAKPTLTDDDCMCALNIGGTHTQTWNATYIHGGVIQALTVNSEEIAADAITATKLNVIGIDGASGRIVVADATDADVITAGINTYAATLIQPGKILISGSVNLDDWSHGSDATKIDGGDIYTNSITATQIAADAITAEELNIAGIDGTTGRILVADATDANAIIAGINSFAATYIEPGKILISGAVNLDGWQDATDATLIDGGQLAADSVTATKINVVGLNGVTGRIVVADETDANILTSGINTSATTLINAGKVFIGTASYPTNMVAYYKLDDVDADYVVDDSSGNGYTGTLAGGDFCSVVTTTGNIGTAFQFNGSDY